MTYLNNQRPQMVVHLSPRHRDDEHDLQTRCVVWFRKTYREYATLLFAVGNGGARNVLTGHRLKMEGVTAGVADLVLLHPKGLPPLFIEMKTPKGRQSASQKEWQQTIEAAGYRYLVVRDFDTFKSIVQDFYENSEKSEY